jgi:hypothetical protein
MATRSVKAVLRGTYETAFLRILGVTSADLSQVGVAPLAVASMRTLVPLGLCYADYQAQAGANNPRWVIWSQLSDLCGVPGWNGFVDLDGTAYDSCPAYQGWIAPAPPSGPMPPPGATVTLDPIDCLGVPLWFIGYPSNKNLSVPVIDTSGGKNTIVGCLTGKLKPGAIDVDIKPQKAPTIRDCGPTQIE